MWCAFLRFEPEQDNRQMSQPTAEEIRRNRVEEILEQLKEIRSMVYFYTEDDEYGLPLQDTVESVMRGVRSLND